MQKYTLSMIIFGISFTQFVCICSKQVNSLNVSLSLIQKSVNWFAMQNQFQLICYANQLTDFYMRETLTFNSFMTEAVII